MRCGVARFAAGLAECLCLIFCKFLVGTSRFVIGTLHRLATTWTTGLSGLRKTMEMPSQVVGIPAELRFEHLPNMSQNDAAGISYNRLFVVLRPNAGHDLLILEVSRSHKTTHHSR